MEHYLTLKYFCVSHKDQRVVFYLKSSEMSWLALSDLFEYLCYGSTAIRNILFFSVRGSS